VYLRALASPVEKALMRRHLLSAALVMGLGGGIAVAQSTPPIAVTRSTAPIVLDGRLDEPVWRGASAGKLIQQSPLPGKPTPYTTEVRVVRAGNDLFFVWNRRWQMLILAPGDLSLVPDSELLAVKLRWTFRL
jgi:hypothetical protein